jgi:hypothetical protein
MVTSERTRQEQLPAGILPAPVHPFSEGTPLKVCVLVRIEPDPVTGPFVTLKDFPGARVYLGAVCDARARVQDLVEIWVQTFELRDLTFSGYQERLTNFTFDQRWRAESQLCASTMAEILLATGMEESNPGPVLVKATPPDKESQFAESVVTPWRICKDDAVLDSFGLPPYSTSPYRYLHVPGGGEPKTFVATCEDAPANSHVQPVERLKADTGYPWIFNPHAGFVRVVRLSPLALEDYLQVLEGRPWPGVVAGTAVAAGNGVYSDLVAWSAQRKGTSFLLHGCGTPENSRNEVFFLKLSALLGMFKEVRSYVKAHQLPLLNLTPSSFAFRLQDAGSQFPALWTARCALVKPGQAFPLQIKSTEQKYFIRLGRVEPSPFLPEGLGAHSFGIGSVRLRNVQVEGEAVVLEGTLVAEDYLALDPHDLLWFKLPLGEEKLEFYAHVYTSGAVGPREARFRTVAARLPEPIVATLKKSLISFSKAPYEVWPLLSSPCDMHSLGIIGLRTLLANSGTNLPVLIDDVLGLARHLGKEDSGAETLAVKLTAALQEDARLKELISPRALIEGDITADAAWLTIHKDLWTETMVLMLRLFPGAGTHSICKSFGDVSPLALETVFDQPIQAIETLCLRLRSVLVPSLYANEEIARIVQDQLANA